MSIEIYKSSRIRSFQLIRVLLVSLQVSHIVVSSSARDITQIPVPVGLLGEADDLSPVGDGLVHSSIAVDGPCPDTDDLVMTSSAPYVGNIQVDGGRCLTLNLVSTFRDVTLRYCTSSQVTSLITCLPSATLRSLDLSRRQITSIGRHAFADLIHVEHLNVAFNRLAALSRSSFDDLQATWSLNLSHNRLTNVHPGLFRRMRSLRLLDLSSNRLHWFSLSFQWPSRNFVCTDAIYDDVIDYGQAYPALAVNLTNNPLSCNWSPSRVVTSYACRNGTVTRQHAPSMHVNVTIVSDKPTGRRHQPPDATAQTDDVANCSVPQFVRLPVARLDIQYGADAVIGCEAVGLPGASVVWITPLGSVLGHASQLSWLTDVMHWPTDDMEVIAFERRSTVEALANGHLKFRNFRYYFAGNYSCVAENAAGHVIATVEVAITNTYIAHHVNFSLIYGAVTALGCLFVSVVIRALGCRKQQQQQQHKNVEKLLDAVVQRENDSDETGFAANHEVDKTGADGTNTTSRKIADEAVRRDRTNFCCCARSNEFDTEEQTENYASHHPQHHTAIDWRSIAENIRDRNDSTMEALRQGSDRLRAEVAQRMELVKHGVRYISEQCLPGGQKKDGSETEMDGQASTTFTVTAQIHNC